MSENTFRLQPALPRESIGFARKSFHGAKAVGSFLPRLTTKALQKYGFSTASVITDWPTIVGSEIARYAMPERLKWPRTAGQPDEEGTEASGRRPGAVLVLRVDAAKALDIQYRAAQIIEAGRAARGHVFNLGHGVIPSTDPDQLARLTDFVHEYEPRG